MKTCSKCKKEKKFAEFYKSNQTKDGFRSYCKKCISDDRKNNIEKFKEKDKVYYQKNKEKRKKYSREYYEDNLEKSRKRIRKYYQKNKEKQNKNSREYYYNNRKEILKQKRKYLNENKKTINKKQRDYSKNNREKLNKKVLYRYKNDIFFKLKCNLRSRTRLAFKAKKWNKGKGTEILLGASFEIVKLHIERKFTSGMNWDNQGEWHIDHIIPLSSANTEAELLKLCHYRNLQPLWAVDNLSKGATIPNVQIQMKL